MYVVENGIIVMLNVKYDFVCSQI